MCPWPGRRLSGDTCDMAVDGRDRGPSVIPHFILIEKNLPDGLDHVDRTGYTPADGIYSSSSRRTSWSRRDISIGRDRRRPIAKTCRHCLVHRDPTQIPHASRNLIVGHKSVTLLIILCCCLDKARSCEGIASGPSFFLPLLIKKAIFLRRAG